MPPPAKAGGNVVPAPVATDAASIAARVTKLTSQVAEAEKGASEALAKAKESLKGEPNEDTLKQVTESLASHQKALVELQTGLTQDINQARKGGPAAMTSVAELSKLSPKVRTSQAGITTELNKAKAQLTRIQQTAKAAEAKEQQKNAEEKDSKELEETLPVVKELIDASDTSVTSVLNMATPLLSEPPEDGSDALKTAMDEIEEATSKAQEKIAEARKDINAKLQAARSYAPETRKRALAECAVLQQKLSEAQNKLNPYKSFRKDFRARIDAKKQLTEITDNLGNVELEVEKASMVTAIAEKGAMSDEEVTSAEEIISPLQKDLANTLRVVDMKLRAASGAMKDELSIVKDRGLQSKKKLEEISLVLKKQKDAKAIQLMMPQRTRRQKAVSRPSPSARRQRCRS